MQECDSKMHKFKEFLDALNTAGGHVFLCFAVGIPGVLLGIVVTWLFWADKELAVTAAGFAGAMSGFLQVAAYAMQGREKANGAATTVTKTVEETKTTETPAPITESKVE